MNSFICSSEGSYSDLSANKLKKIKRGVFRNTVNLRTLYVFVVMS